jgi:hypothetical protein
MIPRTIMLAVDKFMNDLEDRDVRGVCVSICIAPDFSLPKDSPAVIQLRCVLPDTSARLLALNTEIAQCKADLAVALGSASHQPPLDTSRS